MTKDDLAARLTHRFLWTWDHSMDWAPLADGLQEWGCFNDYTRKPEDFLEDYKRAIDFFGPLGFTGIIVYGLFRDAHGGVDAAKELCRYARRKGTKIIAGVGINAYGGIYWEGKHEFNLPHWLEEHPELAAVGASSVPLLRMACPSKKENAEWHRRAIQWLCETVDIGGINFESGDYGLCRCEACQERFGRDYFSVGHMSEFIGPLIEQATRSRPGILSICECYFDRLHDAQHYAPLKDLPPQTMLQFCINKDYLPRFLELDRANIAALGTHRKILRTHIGTQWSGERQALVAKDFARIATHAAETGMDGTTIFGEVTDRKTVHEINYLSAARFADNPRLSWKEFVSDTLGPLLGGATLAEKYMRILAKSGATPGDLRFVKSVLGKCRPNAHRRWMWLCELLYRRIDHQDGGR